VFHCRLKDKAVPIFILSDQLKTVRARTEMLRLWHETRGILVTGYEMFTLLLDSKSSDKSKSKKSDKRVSVSLDFNGFIISVIVEFFLIVLCDNESTLQIY
jgi:hypothetical protein